MSLQTDVQLDFNREDRIGLDEAIFCEGKTADQIDELLRQAHLKRNRFLLTRLSQEKQQDMHSFVDF